MSTIELHSGSATMTARADYLLVVEHGTLSSPEEVLRYVTELELAGQRFQLRRLLVDARSESEETPETNDARSSMWRWIRTQRAFDMIGYVLREEMMIARVNMTALSERLPVRAFAAVADGHRWLARQRPSSVALSAARPAPSSVPPPPMPNRTPVPGPASPIRTPLPRTSVPTAPGTPGRITQRISAMSSQEADAILDAKPRRSTQELPPVERPKRSTQEIALEDRPKRATGEISTGVVRGTDPAQLRRPGEPATPAEIDLPDPTRKPPR